MSTKLSLRVHKVACLDESGGKYAERIGNDEIYLGGFVVAESGDTTSINPVSIYPHFDDGDVKVFNPPKVFKTIDLPQGVWAQPKGFGIGLVLIEKDAGDMVAAVTKIADFAERTIKEKLESLGRERNNVTAARSAVAAPAVALAPLVIVAIEIAAPVVLDYVKNLIIRAFRDEIFPPQIATLQLPSSTFTWSGATDSAEKTVAFRAHGAHYTLTYDWKLS